MPCRPQHPPTVTSHAAGEQLPLCPAGICVHGPECAKDWRAANNPLKKASLFACPDCGAFRPLTIDHIIPRALGGEDCADNLRLTCQPCNSSKGATPAAQYDPRKAQERRRERAKADQKRWAEYKRKRRRREYWKLRDTEKRATQAVAQQPERERKQAEQAAAQQRLAAERADFLQRWRVDYAKRTAVSTTSPARQPTPE